MKSNYCQKPVAALSAMTAIGILLSHCRAGTSGGGGTIGAVGEGLSALVPTVVQAFGSVEITMELKAYEYKTTTSYRGVNSASTYRISVDTSGKESYTTISEMSGVDNPFKTSSPTPFSLSVGGLPGDVPFAIRKHRCTDLTLGDGTTFTATTDAKITYKITHRYKSNPWTMSPTTVVEINLTRWDRERQTCDPVYGKTDTTFKPTIANNGVSIITISDGKMANISHGAGSGIGITW